MVEKKKSQKKESKSKQEIEEDSDSEEVINKEVSDFVDKRKKQQIKILSDLIAQDTVNPPGNEYRAAAIIKKHLDKLKIKHKTFEKTKGRTNLVAYIGNEDKECKTILISAHLDTVPPGEGWDTDPFKAVIKDDLMYGRGTSDNKGQAAASLLVLEYLKSKEEDLKNRFIFVFAADEEMGSGEGIKYLLAKKLLTADYAIIPDICGKMKHIDIAEKGVLNLKITSIGKQAHAAYPHKGVSAIANMSKFITKLDYYNLKCEVHPYLSKPTINFGTINGGSAPNTVAGTCEMVINIRYLPSQTQEGIIEELKTLGERFGVFEFETIAHILPSEIDADNILVKTIQNVASQYGINPKPHGMSGATDTKSFVLNGIPAVGFDFADDYTPHNANEYCNLDNLFKFCKILIDICTELDSSAKL